MLKQTLISVVIPMYNAEKTIEACLQSVIAQQDSDDVEVIVVDDGSTDGSHKIIDEIKKNYEIKYLIQNNSGPYVARKNGIQIARGKYVVCLDSDDILTGGSLSSLRKILEEQPEVDFVWFQHDVLSNANIPADKGIASLGKTGHFVQDQIGDVRCALFRGTSNELWSKAIKKDLLLKERKIHPRKLGEDFSQLIDVVTQAKSCYVTDKILYRYTDGAASSLSCSYSKSTVEDIRILCWQLIDAGNKCGDSCKCAATEGAIAQLFNLARITVQNGSRIDAWLGAMGDLIDECKKEGIPNIKSKKLKIFSLLLRTKKAPLIEWYVETIEVLKSYRKR